jgi:hypothetical protein
LLQPPQLFGSLVVSVQVPLHATWPAGHDDVQVPFTHVWPEAHAFPQVPQLFASVLVLISQPSAGFLLQSAKPALQVI